MLVVLALGFASGLPLALTSSTLTFRLAEARVDIGVIGFFAWVGVAYGWKFLWAPVMDRLRLPVLTRLLGRRRGWLLVTQALLALSILALGRTDPADLAAVAAWAVVVAFLSASQDIVIDAYRVEILDQRRQGAGAAAVTVGYRVAMLVSGAGTLVLAETVGWAWAYAAMALLLAAGAVAALLHGEPAASEAAEAAGTRRDLGGRLRQAVVEPFADFLARNGAGTAALILLFVALYKLGDALLGAVMSPFYVDLGFGKAEVATIVKTYGLVATLAGVLAGGAVVRHAGLLRGLWICGVAQMLSNLVYILQARVGHDPAMLAATITVENLAGGMGTAAFVAYLSSLCNLNYTATQYALLSSFMAQARTLLSGFAGVLQQAAGWTGFFLLTTAAALPALLLLAWLQRRQHGPAAAPAGIVASAPEGAAKA